MASGSGGHRRRSAWARAGAALAVLVGCAGALIWASFVGSPLVAGASGDPSSVSTPLTTTQTSSSTAPSSSSPSTTPPTTKTPSTTVATKTTATTAPPATRFVTPYTYRSTTTAPTSTTSTTIAGIEGRVAPPVVTVPLATKASNGHVDPALAWVSVGGFGMALLIIGGRLFVTRSRGADRTPMPGLPEP